MCLISEAAYHQHYSTPLIAGGKLSKPHHTSTFIIQLPHNFPDHLEQEAQELSTGPANLTAK